MEAESPRRRAPQPGDRLLLKRRIALFVASLVLWGGLLYGAYYYATDYLESSLRSVQETNALNVQALNERLDAIQLEVQSLKEALDDTDQVLAKSDETREALHQRIEELDLQLEQLEKSLETLGMSPNVAR